MAGRSLNKATLIGHAGKDAEISYTNGGKAVAKFTLATSVTSKDQSGASQERTVWHNIVAWERLAEICGNYVKKGKQVYIEGRIDNRSYEDKDGVKKYFSEIVAHDIILLGGGDRGGNSENGERSFGGSPQRTSEPMATPAGEFDQSVPDADLPF